VANSKWTTADIPDQTGRTYLVTGANSGLGFETAKALAGKGAQVVIACRDAERAQSAVREIEKEMPGVEVSTIALDLASLESIRSCCEKFKKNHGELHGLINNAGVMALPERRTADGFEMQFGTNHLGHFALTAQLIEPLLAASNARVVTLSSTAHLTGRMRWDDLQWERGYQNWLAYGQSKLANLLFARELGRRLEARGCEARSIACHPGYAATNLQRTGPQMAESGAMEGVMDIANRVFAQSAQMGALPTLYAATAGEAKNGHYIGPDGFFGTAGHPSRATPSRRARSREDAARLWKESESLTGVEFRV